MMTDQQKLDLASKAVTWLLRRIKEDPRLAYLIGPGSESFDRLMAANAAITGEEPETLHETYLSTEPQPVLPIGQLGAILHLEHLERIRVYDDGVHDVDDQDDLNMLVNHFVGRGLDVAEAERDTQTESLF
jgi:hypothetical protein